MSIIKQACGMVEWTEKELIKEAKRLGWTPEYLAEHLIKEERIKKKFNL